MAELLSNEYIVSLETIGQGAALELFGAELRKVIDNIADLNTDAKSKRKITLDVVIAPEEDRKEARVWIDCRARLAPHRGEGTTVYFGIVEGRRQAVESNPTQGKLFDKPDGQVVPLATKKGE